MTALVNESGVVQERYVYDPYGRVTIYDDEWSETVDWDDSKKNEILYCGYRLDPETGMYQVRHRYYHPTLGRWISRDREGYIDGMNLYEYVRSRPAVVTDPSGTMIPDRRLEHEWKHGETVSIKSSEYQMGGFGYGGYWENSQYEVGELKWLGESGMNGIALSNGGTVGYWMARHWVENKTWDGTRKSFLAFAKAHDASQACGPETTYVLGSVLRRIKLFYTKELKSDYERKESCCAVFDHWEGGLNISSSRAWDITELYGMSKTGYREPRRSVRISGRCYDAAAVNYAMFGLVGKLCGKKISFLIDRVNTWKRWKYGSVPTYETIDWMKAGYNGWTAKTKVPSTTPYTVKDDPKRQEKGYLHFRWLPHRFITM